MPTINILNRIIKIKLISVIRPLGSATRLLFFSISHFSLIKQKSNLMKMERFFRPQETQIHKSTNSLRWKGP